ncbi:MAG TPA: V-type ATPase subunit subunit G family protein [Nitrososphaerales archaeon]
MSHTESSHLEGVVSTLSEMEKEIDAVKADAEEMKRAIVALARDEAEKIKNQIVSSANETVKNELNRATADAERNAKEIVQKGDVDVKKLQGKINAALDKAVDSVVKAVLGD